MKFPTYEEMAQNVAEKALDEYEYKGKTLRQWIEIVLATDNNVGTKLSTNLAEVGTDCISRQAAIDALENTKTAISENGERYIAKQNAIMRIDALPSAQSEIIRCKDCKWYGRADKRRFYRGMDCLQKRIDTIVPDKDFCSRAERRTDG